MAAAQGSGRGNGDLNRAVMRESRSGSARQECPALVAPAQARMPMPPNAMSRTRRPGTDKNDLCHDGVAPTSSPRLVHLDRVDVGRAVQVRAEDDPLVVRREGA